MRLCPNRLGLHPRPAPPHCTPGSRDVLQTPNPAAANPEPPKPSSPPAPALQASWTFWAGGMQRAHTHSGDLAPCGNAPRPSRAAT